MILEIKKYPNQVLRKKCEEVREITPEIKELALNMEESMVKDKGIGLAAPQVGVSKKIIIVHLVEERSPEEKNRKVPQAFINPKIIKKSRETAVEEEGCLSFPDLFLKIKRAEEVEVETLNLNGEKIKIEAKGLPAQILQHEIDHLDGILFIDKIGFWQKLKLKRQLQKSKPQ